MKLFRSFMSDDDGFSAKDFLMVLFGTLFVLMIATAFIISIVGTLPASTIAVIQLMDGVMITIVGGVFGLQGIKEFKSKGSTTTTIQPDNDTYNGYVEPENVPVEDNASTESTMKLP